MWASSISRSLPLYQPEIQTLRCPKNCFGNSTVSADWRPRRRCVLHDLHTELLPYSEAWSWQKAIVDEKMTLSKRKEDVTDSLIVLQHQPVYTLGTGSSLDFLHFDAQDSPIDLFRTERGGEITYHGPGQLVMYPIINLRYHEMDLHWYLRALEEVVIRALFSAFALKASRIEGLTGVWVGDKKLAAIGIKVSQWIAYHGLALNVTTDLLPFQHIVPCGIRGREVGSVKGLLQGNSSQFGWEAHELEDRELIDLAYESLIKAFSEVFRLELFRNSSHSKISTRVSENSWS